MEGNRRRTRRIQQTETARGMPDPSVQEVGQQAPQALYDTHRRRRQALTQAEPSGARTALQEETARAQRPKKNVGNQRIHLDKAAKAAGDLLLTLAVLLGAAGRALMGFIRKAYASAVRALAGMELRRLPVRGIAMLLLVLVALGSAYQIVSIVLRSSRTSRLNEELSQLRAEYSEQEHASEDDFVAYDSEEASEAAAELTEMPQAEAVYAAATQAGASVSEGETQTAPALKQEIVRTTKYHHVGGEALAEMAALHKENRDLVAWIEIPDVLDLPIVYRDNDYYLTRDFYKKKNASGTIFLDENHPFKEKTQNLLLHGHNMKDGTMFGRLTQYLYDESYLKNHPFIYFNTLWRKEQYAIFAVLNVSLDTSSDRFFNYFTHDTFATDAEFRTYVRQLQLRSEFAIPLDVQPGDALLTLSTCLEDDRLVIVARRLREDEARSTIRPIINTATRQ